MQPSNSLLSILVFSLFLETSCGKNTTCEDNAVSYRRCLGENLAEHEERRCSSCLQENGWLRLDPFEDCSQVQELFCNIPSRCGCDPCLEEIKALNECWYPTCTYETLCEPSQNYLHTTKEFRLKVDGYLLKNRSDTDIAISESGPLCFTDTFKDCLRNQAGRCFGSKRRRLQKTGKSLDNRRLELGADGSGFRVCQERILAFNACMADFGTTEAQNCADCMRARIPNHADYCFELWDLFCRGPYECCGQCQSEIQKVVECYYEPCEADITCAVTGVNGDPPSCIWESISDCVDECVSLAIQSDQVVDTLESFIECTAVCADPCLIKNRRLVSVKQSYVSALVGLPARKEGDGLHGSTERVLSSSRPSSVGSITATAYQENTNSYFCRAEIDAYQACLGGLGQLAAEQCWSCVNARFPTNPVYCYDLQDLCYAPYECGCGQCGDMIQDFLECANPPCKLCARGDEPPLCSELDERLLYNTKWCLKPCLQPIEGEGW